MILYKYYPPERRQPLRDQTLRITQFNQLNDPLDCLPVISMKDYEEAQDAVWREAAFESFVARGGKGGIEGNAFLEFLKKIPGIERDYKARLSAPATEGEWHLTASQELQDTMSNTYGIVCLSELADSLLMWSHYAKDHTGYVIGIDPTALHLPGIQSSVVRVQPVIYHPERIQTTPRHDDMDFLYRKSLEWDYEKEWRLVLPLIAGKRVSQLPDIWVREFGAQSLREIVIGCKAGDNLKNEIAKVKAKMPWVRIRHASPSAIRHAMILTDDA